MKKIISFIKLIVDFFTDKLWKLRIDKLNTRQGFLLKQLRILILSVQRFTEDKCVNKATALTYYTLFSIVPVIALAFAIAKGFDFQKKLQSDLLLKFHEQQEILTQAFTYADKLLNTTKGGIIAGVGIILLLWSVMKLLGNIEDSFNDIWKIKRSRSFVRKITDYLSIMLIAPLLMLISGGLSVIINNKLDEVISQLSFLSPLSFLMQIISYLFLWSVFLFIYIVLPNTKVTFKAAAPAALVATILFKLLQWAYVTFQVYTVQYNAIYGSFAALPLFLIWMQYSWFIVLYGAELAFANQNVEHFELENEISNISDRYKRVIALMIANVVVKNFNEGKEAMNVLQIAQRLDLPVRLARTIVMEFVETGVFNEVRSLNVENDICYQPGITDNKLTVKFIIDKLDERGVNYLPIDNTNELDNINRLMKDMDEVLNTTKGNMLVKDIV